MPRIKDKRIIENKRRIRTWIRDDFRALMDEGRSYEYAINKLMAKYGYSESTLYQIIKQTGKYAD